DACEGVVLSSAWNRFPRSCGFGKLLKTRGDHKMGISRRTLLRAAGSMPLWTGAFAGPAFAQAAAPGSGPAEIPPILFVHGNGDHAALWVTTLWRMESNGVAPGRDAGRDVHNTP